MVRTRVNLLLQIISGHVLKLDLLGAINIGSICENAERQTRTRDVGESVCEIVKDHQVR